jgi:hypothetical protein
MGFRRIAQDRFSVSALVDFATCRFDRIGVTQIQ